MLRVGGEIDLATRPVLHAELTRALDGAPAHLVVDLAAVAFCCVRGFVPPETSVAATATGTGYALSGLRAHPRAARPAALGRRPPCSDTPQRPWRRPPCMRTKQEQADPPNVFESPTREPPAADDGGRMTHEEAVTILGSELAAEVELRLSEPLSQGQIDFVIGLLLEADSETGDEWP